MGNPLLRGSYYVISIYFIKYPGYPYRFAINV